MKSPLTLLNMLITECGEYCAVDTTLDLKAIKSRVDHEGLEFLISTLPTLGSGLERGLALGKASPNLFPGFRCRQNLPVIFGGFFDLVFDRVSGVERDDASPEAIRSLRQICLFMKKIELPWSKEAEASVLGAYVTSDKEVGEWEQGVTPEVLLEFHQMASQLFSRALLPAEYRVRDFRLEPKHGPGATADKLIANQKFTQPTWHQRLEDVMPFWRYATTRGYSSERYDHAAFLEPGQETPVKVVLVPKTLAAPRVIAEESTCMQYAQQGLNSALKECIDNSYLVHFIGTDYQEPNQLLALEGSITGNLATLDLKEASDRVSNLLVKTLFAGLPHLGDAIQASRSLTADVPGVGNIPLHRFASMGSALCFPVETMVFLTVVAIGIRRALHLPLHRVTSYMRSKMLGRVRIYGDDIIVPVEVADSVRAALRLYGFIVNSHKSFWTGWFRESCGREYYRGEDVTLARLTHPLPDSRDQVTELVSAVALRNNLYKRGLWKTAGVLDEMITSLIPFPVVAETSSVLGRLSCLGIPKYPVGGRYQLPLVKGAVVRYRRRLSPIDGEAALMKAFSREFSRLDQPRPDEVTSIMRTPESTLRDEDHLRYSGRPVASAIHYRMAPAL